LFRHTDRASLIRPMPPPPAPPGLEPAPPGDRSAPPALLDDHRAPRLRAVLAPLVREAVALVAPPVCPSCRAALGAAWLRLCPACAAALPWLPRRCCPCCALPSHRGRRCPAAAASFSRAWAPLAYEGVARDLVGALKFRGALPLADLMAAHVVANLPADLRPRAGRPPDLAGPDLAIVPVPPQRVRRRRRGFDPAGAVAAGVGARLGVPVLSCLERRDRAARQVGAGRRARRRPGRLDIAVRATPPPRVLLLDDVHTTGATLEACAAALRAAGCGQIAAVTYARTL
jgi:predicted amidophosphoribosyltransferase